VYVFLGGVAAAIFPFAAVEVSSGDPATVLLAYGPLGVMAVLFIFGLIVPKSTVTQKDAEIQRLQALFTDEVIPMVKMYTETMTRVIDNLEESTDALKILADLRRREDR
jgi:hypothetical protein